MPLVADAVCVIITTVRPESKRRLIGVLKYPSPLLCFSIEQANHHGLTVDSQRNKHIVKKKTIRQWLNAPFQANPRSSYCFSGITYQPLPKVFELS